MKELSLAELWIYPIKSLGGIRLTSAKVMPKGLQYDRRWMLVDGDNTFMTQRIYSQLALFKTTLVADYLVVNFNQSSIQIPLRISADRNPEDVTIWNDTVTAFEVSAEASKWFSSKAGISCKLVYFPEENSRPVDARYKVNDENVSLADAYPFLIIGKNSLRDLNQRLREPVPMNRFRPNFVFEGGNPYEEDTWRNFSIGKNNFIAVKPCARCVLTTIDQDTGVRNTEPLKTLAAYRTKNNNVYFGQNLVATTTGEIKVGDIIKVTSYQ